MRILADSDAVAVMIDQLAEQIEGDLSRADERARQTGAGPAPWALVGVRSRGDVLARRLARRLGAERVGTLDITLYRDDLSEVAMQPEVRTTEIPFAIDGLNIVLVDDVLMTGRSVRAALQSLIDLGRPRRVWLSVLVDRGGRELPIAADHVGLDLSQSLDFAAGERAVADSQPSGVKRGGGLEASSAAQIGVHETVEVRLTPTDDRDAVEVRSLTQSRSTGPAVGGAPGGGGPAR